MEEKILVAMSGGVDSSVAAFLIKQGGTQCGGAIMNMFKKSNSETSLPIKDDSGDAKAVAQKLDIPFFVFDCSNEFKKYVTDEFIASYRRGDTPNPCIECNKYLKFGEFGRRGEAVGYTGVATGHYAQIKYDAGSGRMLLCRGADIAKDQSYVLYGLTQKQLRHLYLPLGGMTKNEVREIAEDCNFITAYKNDSQDICFIPDGDYAAYIERETGRKLSAGNFITCDGKIIAPHKGFERYTIGQRRGLGLSLPAPLYVCAKRPCDCSVILGKEADLMKKSLIVKNINLIACEELKSKQRTTVKIRYRFKEAPAIAEQVSEDEMRIEFDEPQRAISPGQSAVLYDGDVVIGGGIIA